MSSKVINNKGRILLPTGEPPIDLKQELKGIKKPRQGVASMGHAALAVGHLRVKFHPKPMHTACTRRARIRGGTSFRTTKILLHLVETSEFALCSHEQCRFDSGLAIIRKALLRKNTKINTSNKMLNVSNLTIRV